MALGKAPRLLLSLIFASGVTLAAHHFDGQRGRAHVTETATRGARQVAAQVEALYLEGKGSEEDPLGRAIYSFSQAPEPRFAEVKRLDGPIASGASEASQFNPDNGVLEYSKAFSNLESEPDGVRVRVLAWRPGFLGARTTLQNDLTLLGIFLLNLFAALFIFRFRSREVVRETVKIERVEVVRDVEVPVTALPAKPKRTPAAKALIQRLTAWKTAARAALLQTGGEVREVVRSAHDLTAAAQSSLEKLLAVQAKMRGELTSLHASRLTADAIAKALAECEAHPERLIKVISHLRQVSDRNAQSLRTLERQIEPWATDVDLAVGSFDEFAAASDRMRAHIRKTTELMLEQARLAKELESELELKAPAAQEVKSASGGEPTRSIA